MKITEKVRKLVKKECDIGPLKKDPKFQDIYESHVIPVRDFAIKLAKIYHADKEIVELAALLHDIEYIKTKEHEIHEITGAETAVKILRKLKYPEKRIQKVKACILCHRGSKKSKRESIEQKIVASADAMDHIDDIITLFCIPIQGGEDIEKAMRWTLGKIERGWKKIELPEGRKIVKKKYLVARAFFKTFLK